MGDIKGTGNQVLRVVIAGLCSLVVPAGGQVYNRDFWKALAVWAVYLVLVFTLGTTRGITTVGGMTTWVLVTFLLQVGSLVEACLTAARTPPPESDFRRQMPVLLGVGLMAVLLWTVKPHRYVLSAQTLRVTSTANWPAMMTGDLVVIDLVAYRSANPEYGDLVIFQGVDGRWTIFRVMGLPGDRVMIEHGILRVNGVPSTLAPIRDFRDQGYDVTEYLETHPSGVQTRILRYDGMRDSWPLGADVTEVQVPPDAYFLLGDFRGQAEDSRHLGMVARKNIRARAVLLFSTADDGFPIRSLLPIRKEAPWAAQQTPARR